MASKSDIQASLWDMYDNIAEVETRINNAFGPVEQHERLLRNVYCPAYGSCINYVTSKGWENFTCEYCIRAKLSKNKTRDLVWVLKGEEDE